MINSFHNVFKNDSVKLYSLERVNFNDNVYFVIYKVKEQSVPLTEKINEAKELLECDTVLRSNGYLYFCQQMTNAEIIEETFK